LVLVFEPNAQTSEAPVDLRLQMNTPLTWGFPEGGFPSGSRSLDGPSTAETMDFHGFSHRPSGKHTKNDGKSNNQFSMGKSTISMGHFQ